VDRDARGEHRRSRAATRECERHDLDHRVDLTTQKKNDVKTVICLLRNIL
jgi:hypothetical protein